MTKKNFDILHFLSDTKGSATQREIAAATNMSVGTVNKLMAELTAKGLVKDGKITPAGSEALEPYRVRRAIFIAAGFGSRMVPVTLNTPKPLVRVKGERIIDSLLDAVVAAGIEEIYLVRGYLGEQFDQLLYKYPNIKFIENPLYNQANNISSVLKAKDALTENTYIFEADILLYNKKLITKYQYSSNYLGVPVKTTDDWCLYTENGKITKVAVGGTDCYQMYGISYWSKADAKKLQDDVEAVYTSPGGKERYWDQVPLDFKKENYSLSVRECTFNDIIEIDSFNELKKLDSSYNV
ncbi:MAG: NTP transferase domain-containing protein [Clostridia bacterium]|nr:NTP transferase domain-containing protein [Clostridia bacterium]